MTENLIRFEKLEWDRPKKGVCQKVHSEGAISMRLLRFSDDFVEVDWCLKGHIGLVLQGEMKIDFNGTIKYYKKGDGLWIEKGEDARHKVMIEKGKSVEMILFESVE